MITFEEGIKKGIVRKIAHDLQRAENLLTEAQRKITSLNERVTKIGIKDENANDYVEYCYDIIMMMVRAKMYMSGFSTSGQGAHEAEIAYMQVLNIPEIDIRTADKLRYFRNGMLYYGTRLDEEYARKTIQFAKKMYAKLKES